MSTKPTILYVDDEPENLLVFKSSFRRKYHIITAESGAEAQEILKKQPDVDVIISDQRMPHLNGVELLSGLPDEPDNVRMILTGYSDIEAVIKALNHGKIHKYISKPWEKSSLGRIIDDEFKALESRRMTRSSVEVQSAPSPSSTGVSDVAQGDPEQIQILKKQLKESYDNVLLLSEIGQEVIQNRDIRAIIEKTYGAINTLLDASVFACGLYNPERNVLEYTIMERSEWLNGEISVDDHSKAGVWTFVNQAEIFSNHWLDEAMQYTKERPTVVSGETSLSLIYLPLMRNDEAIGVLTVQSFNENAYSKNDLNIMKNMAIYVSTALENAEAYNRIEQHKLEIEEKNIELEQKVKERTQDLQRAIEEVERQKDEVEVTYKKVQLLSKIGQQVNSTLSLDKISNLAYAKVNELMDATIFGIGIYDHSTKLIEFPSSVEKGKVLPTWSVALDEEDRIPALCFNTKKEIVINNFSTEYKKYISHMSVPKEGESPESIIYIPLIIEDDPIGVITVQSMKKHVYNQYHLDILRSLAIYVATAIQNASTYRRMTRAFDQLKSTQSKLVESEKMASLGVLTAGVAHEINNPVNFISGGIASLRENYNDIEELLNMLLSLKDAKGKEATKLSEEIDAFIAEIELKDLMGEIQALFDSISNGAIRSKEIVKGLKNFSRLDENDMKTADLEEGLDSTLVILNNQIKNRIKVTKNYGGIPEVTCFPGQLNQVFMNILNNATQAIQGEGEITISTRQIGDKVEVKFTDTGGGIPADIKDHIFEPFFTTKGVGEGTGLGLSICYGIINEHNGTISVESEEGVGSTFTVVLPIS